MSDIVGIDLGTTNSLIGVMESGFPILLPDQDGQRLTPSVVSFPSGGEPLVGRAAQRARAAATGSTVYSVKRLMGVRAGTEETAGLDYQVVPAEDGWSRIRIDQRDFSPEQISAFILAKLKKDAERALERQVSRAVITVPAYFNDAQRTATKHAGELAGFTVERIVNEPTAAALAYGLSGKKEKSTIAVYDLGGGTFDISILSLSDGLFEVLATNGNTRLGGDDIDSAILRHLLRQLDPRLGPPDLPAAREAVIGAKHRLSEEEEAAVYLPFRNGQIAELTLSRERLNEIARPLLEKTQWHCARVLADARLKAEQIQEVILVGGVTRMPVVREFVGNIFQRKPNISQHPEEAVAIGATIQGGILSGAFREVILLDVTPLSLGIETFGGLMNVIIPRNSTIPIKAGEMFTTAVNNQRAMSITILQGEREMARDNWTLGQFEIEFESAPKGIPRVGVQFAIDANGILEVLARDTHTGSEKKIEVTSAVDVSDDAVERMLANSLESAFEDMSERSWTEAKLKAEEMLTAVADALALAGETIAPREHNAITDAVRETEEAILTRNLQRLQRANSALDDATQNLAAVVLEKAAAALPQS